MSLLVEGLAGGLSSGDQSFRMYGVKFEPHLYVAGRPRGIFLAPFTGIGLVQMKDGATTWNDRRLAAGGSLGYAWTAGRLTLQVSGGGEVVFTEREKDA